MNQKMLSQKLDVRVFSLLSFFCGTISIYYFFTIPSNSIWSDQIQAINLAKTILDGDFPLVGYLHSNKIHSFPAFYYFISPIVYISDKPIFLYWSVAIINTSGMIILANYIYKNFGFQVCLIFLLFSVTHVSSLFYSSFLWNPNYIPFFMSLFLLSFFKYLKNKSSVTYFHFSGILINIILQMMPQTIVLIPSFIFILFLFKKLPNLVNQFVHVIIQVAMVYPWIHHHAFIFDWKNFESGQKLFKGFSIAIVEYMNYLGGWVLNSEYPPYLNYGTNTYPYTKLIDLLLKGSSIMILLLILFSTYTAFRNIKEKKLVNFSIDESNIDEVIKKYLIVVSVINLSCLLFFLAGLHMEPHHYQFLSPVLALNMALLISSGGKYKKILGTILIFYIFLQGTFSYWRAYTEFKKPYVTDIGFSDKFSNYFANFCKNDSRAYVLDTRGLQFLQSSKGDDEKKSCGKLVLVLRDHYEQSKIVRWFFEKNYSMTDMNFKDYLIWSSKK